MEEELVFQVDTFFADDPDNSSIDILTPEELLKAYPWLRQFQSDIEEGLFSMQLTVALYGITIHCPSYIPVAVPEVEHPSPPTIATGELTHV